MPAISGPVAAAAPIHRKVLPNGLVLLVEEDPSKPLVAFHAVVRAGSATEGEFLGSGISHVVEHMLFKGTGRRGVGQVEAEARSYGGTTQGYTTYDTTAYQLTVNKEFWRQGADLLLDALFSPSMDAAEFSKERDVVLRELKMRDDDPERLAWDLLFETAYQVHPYRIPIIGYEPLMTRLTREEAAAYHRRYYVPNNVVLAVTGDVKAKELFDRVEELTQAIPPGRVPPSTRVEEPLQLSPREALKEAPAAHAILAVGFPGVALASDDLFALDCLSWILGGGRGSVLEKGLKETGVVYSVHSYHYTPSQRGLFVVSMRLEPENLARAKALLGEALRQVREEPLPPREIEAAQKAVVREYLSGRQTVAGRASDLATHEVLAGDPDFSRRYVERMMKLTPQDLQRVARRYLDGERMTVTTLVPQGRASEGAFSSAQAAAAPAKPELAALKNGLRLILLEDHRVPLVTIQVSMAAGVRCEDDENNGISALTARMLLRGTRRRGPAELNDLLRGMGASLVSVSGRNSLNLTIEVVGSELPKAVSLLGEIIQEPGFSTDELEKERKLLLAELAAQEEDPFSWGIRRLMRTLFTVHPYRLDPLGNKEAVSRVTHAELEAFFDMIRDPKWMVVGMAGDFKKEEAVRHLTAAFEKVSPGPGALPEPPEEPELTSPRSHLEAVPRQEGLVLIGFPGIALSDPRLPLVDLAENLLSGGAGRLFAEVRERRGLAYAVGASAIHGVDPGAFVLYALAEPAKMDEVREALLDQMRRLSREPFDPQEFQRAKQGLLGARRIARQSAGARLSQLCLNELYGLGLDFDERYEAGILMATEEDVRRGMFEVLNPEQHVVVIGQPAASEEPAGAELGR
ncbi:MAG: insulinase family protein [Candidatus Omnitrophica bacterium]|nr:insulinase family protein [Candidatus Omnitrophota bacterium]